MLIQQLTEALEQALQTCEQLAEQQTRLPSDDIQGVIVDGLGEFKQQGVTQDLVALQADISLSTLKKLKSNPSGSNVDNLAKLLDVLGYDLCAVKR